MFNATSSPSVLPMLTLRRFLAGLLLLCAFGKSYAQEDPTDPGVTNAPPLEFLYSVAPTNNAILVTETTNVISVTVSNFLAFTNIVIEGRVGTNVIEFIDTGRRPDDEADDGIFRGLLVTPLVLETTELTLELLLTGIDLRSITNDPPAETPVSVTNETIVIYRIVPRPANDRFTNAFKLLSSGGIGVGRNEYASLEPREPVHANVSSVDHSIWWTWSAPADGNVLIDLAGSDFPAVLSVYRGDRVSNLVAIASSTNDAVHQLPPNVSFAATRPTTYRIAVSGLNSNAFGNVRLRVAPGATADTRPPVVSIQTPAQDSLVSTESIVISGSAREPFPLDSGISNVLIQVNGGPRTNAIGAESWSAVIALPPGTNVIRAYAVDYAGNLSEPDSVVVRYLNPTNDYFALSAQLPGTGGFVSAQNDQATREAGEPFHAGNDGGRSVWYWWRAPANGELALSTAGSLLDSLLAVYLGNDLTNLTELVSNDDAFPGSGYSELSLFVVSNEVYRIAVDSYGAAVGEFGLQYVFTSQQAGNFFNLTINPGSGGVVSPPGGAFPSGARVTLTAIPQEDFAFVGWEGDVTSAENPITLTLSRNMRLSARFRTVRYTDDFESAGLSRIPWSTQSPAWWVQTNFVSSGAYAARTPVVGPRESAILSLTTNTGSGTATFDVKVSSEAAWDHLEFLIDGGVVRRWSGEVEWRPFIFTVSAGTHTFMWRYTKDPNFEAGLDAAFIDNLYLPPPRDSGGGTERATLGIHLFSEGAQITIQGEAGVTYILETSSSLAGPWTNVASQSSPSGVINILDLQAIGQSRRFYRAKVQ